MRPRVSGDAIGRGVCSSFTDAQGCSLEGLSLSFSEIVEVELPSRVIHQVPRPFLPYHSNLSSLEQRLANFCTSRDDGNEGSEARISFSLVSRSRSNGAKKWDPEVELLLNDPLSGDVAPMGEIGGNDVLVVDGVIGGVWNDVF